MLQLYLGSHLTCGSCPRPFQCIILSCHHVYAHCTSICVDCSFFPVFSIFSIERDSRSRRVRCEDRRHRWTTLEYDRQVNHLLHRSSIFFCALPTKARANLTFLAYLILPKYFIHHNIAFDSNVNFWSMLEYPMKCMFP